MNVIKSLLAKQDEEFVSLCELLEQIARECGSTLSEAATILGRLLHKTPEHERPDWYIYDRVTGLDLASLSQKIAIESRLRYVVNFNRFEAEPDDDIPF
ncbi:hypothetical protein ACQUFY_16845 [Robbsia andropogonis]|uniref:hypothetical protein n=1 Tax=Robbsia andropogonis TaxID=28092 RepID=UPI003D20DC1C